MQGSLGFATRGGRLAVAAATALAIGLAVLMSLSAGTARAGGARASKALAPIIVGDTCDCSGALVSSSGGWGPAFQVWADWTNAHGGILGHKVKVIEKDTQSNAVTAVTDAQTLLSNRKIVAFVPGASQGTIIEPAINAHPRVPVVGGFCGDASCGTDAHVFPASTTATSLYDALGTLGVKNKTRKAAYIYCAEAPSCQASLAPFTAGVKKAGGSLVYSASISASAPSFTAQCLAAQSAGANYVWVADATTIIEAFAQQCAASNYKPTYVVPDFDSALLTVPALNGMKVVFADEPYLSSEAATFRAAVKKYDPSMTKQANWGQFSFQAWLSGQELAAAIKLAKPTGAITRATVFKGLYAFKNQTLGGAAPPLTFQKGKAPNVPCFFQGTISGGKLISGTKPIC